MFHSCSRSHLRKPCPRPRRLSKPPGRRSRVRWQPWRPAPKSVCSPRASHRCPWLRSRQPCLRQPPGCYGPRGGTCAPAFAKTSSAAPACCVMGSMRRYYSSGVHKRQTGKLLTAQSTRCGTCDRTANLISIVVCEKQAERMN